MVHDDRKLSKTKKDESKIRDFCLPSALQINHLLRLLLVLA
jgi:hypothetical protein